MIGTVVVILLFGIASGCSISPDRQSRHCEYLYSKHARLTTMFDEIRGIASEYDKVIADAWARYHQGELSQVEKRQLGGHLVSERVASVELVNRAFERSRDIVDQGMFDETDLAIRELWEYASSLDFTGLSWDQMIELHASADSIVERAIKQSKSSMLNAGTELRESCSQSATPAYSNKKVSLNAASREALGKGCCQVAKEVVFRDLL